jgi:hypothetical protein
MWLVWQSLVWFANHWLQLVGLAAIVFVIHILLAMNDKLAQVIAHTGLNDWRLRNEVDVLKRGISHIHTTDRGVGENLNSRIWEVRNEIAAVKKLFEGGIYVYGKDEHERRFREQLDYRVQNSERKAKDGAEAGDISAQAHYGELLAIQGDYVQAYMWLDIAITRADKEPARIFRASAIGRRDKIAGEMTSEQITEAKAKALEWLANYPLPSQASDAS